MLAIALAVLLLQSSPPVQGLRHVVFDGYQRLFPLERTSHPVTIVVIDEPSLAKYGQWPWPRTRVAELVERIADAEPAAIGLDLFFAEPDRFSPDRVVAELRGVPEELARWLGAQPGNDAALAAAIEGKRVVVGITAGDPDARFPNPPAAKPVRISGDVRLQSHPGHIGNIEVVDRAAASRGLMNAGAADQVVRRVPLAAQVQGVVVPALGVEALRVAVGAPLTLERRGGIAHLRFGEVRHVIQPDGTAWLRMGPHDVQRFVSAHDVLTGAFRAESVREKVVLVGTTGLGLLDFKTTPLGDFVPGVEIHAQIVENLFNGVWLTRPENGELLEAAALLMAGVLIIILVPRLTALEGANVMAAILVALVGSGLIAFRHYGLLLDPAWPSIGALAVFGTVVVGTLSVSERQRRQLRDQAARMAVEVDAARRIQMGLLADPREAQAGDTRFEIAALLEPARTVGGDFYDCFRIDADRAFLAVGDVSGKGLPAALFMASVKSQIKSAAMRGGDAGAVLARAQREIVHGNPEQLFVTAFAALYDASTGELAFANAGHEPPFVGGPGRPPERLDTSSGGPPLGAIDDFEYATDRRRLAPGEWLCVVTDGATEAMNRRREFLGSARLRSVLEAMPAEADADGIVRRVRAAVESFEEGAERADDLTLLALRRRA